VVGGFAILAAGTMHEAIELTKRFLKIHGDEWDIECEVRSAGRARCRRRGSQLTRGPSRTNSISLASGSVGHRAALTLIGQAMRALPSELAGGERMSWTHRRMLGSTSLTLGREHA
jgi:hypothetical protein